MTVYEQLAEIQAETKQACASIIEACKAIIEIVKKSVRSCIWPTTSNPVNEPTGAHPLGRRSTVYPDWPDSADANYQHRCEKMRENVEKEIAMEELHRDALEILSK